MAAWIDSGTSTNTATTSGSTWTGLYGYKTVEKVKRKPRAATIVPWKHPVKKPDLIAELQHEFDHWAGKEKREIFSG